MKIDTQFEWGNEVARTEIGGISFLAYEPRRRRVPELLLDGARWGRRPYLIQGDRELTFAETLSAIQRVAAHFRALGIGPGDRVMILAANSPEWVVALWAALAIGAIVAPGNGWWSEKEVRHALDLVSPSLILADRARLVKFPTDNQGVEIETLRAIVDDAGSDSDQDEATGAAQVEHCNRGSEADAALIVFTAGTTGLSKGATLAHRSWISAMHQTLAVSGRLPQTLSEDRANVSLITGPMFHMGGLHAIGLGMITGGTLVMLEGKFDAGEVLGLIAKHRVQVWGAIPTMLIRVIEHASLKHRDVSSMQSIPVGGAPVSPELMERVQVAFPNTRRRVTNVYGMTELSGTVARASARVIEEHPGTTGKILPTVELKIVEPDAQGIGEVAIRTPGQMLGYWNETDSSMIDPDGYVHTGDLGRLEDGRLYITGRSKDIVIRGGENIAAPHVESVLLSHPDVADVAVVGLAHEDLGEEVAAAIQLRPGTSCGSGTLAAYARERLASFEVPSRWWIGFDALPMTDAGKANKKQLRTIFPP